MSQVPTRCPNSLVATLRKPFLPNSPVSVPLSISFRVTRTTGPQYAPRQEVTMSEIGRGEKRTEVTRHRERKLNRKGTAFPVPPRNTWGAPQRCAPLGLPRSILALNSCKPSPPATPLPHLPLPCAPHAAPTGSEPRSPLPGRLLRPGAHPAASAPFLPAFAPKPPAPRFLLPHHAPPGTSPPPARSSGCPGRVTRSGRPRSGPPPQARQRPQWGDPTGNTTNGGGGGGRVGAGWGAAARTRACRGPAAAGLTWLKPGRLAASEQDSGRRRLRGAAAAPPPPSPLPASVAAATTAAAAPTLSEGGPHPPPPNQARPRSLSPSANPRRPERPPRRSPPRPGRPSALLRAAASPAARARPAPSPAPRRPPPAAPAPPRRPSPSPSGPSPAAGPPRQVLAPARRRAAGELGGASGDSHRKAAGGGREPRGMGAGGRGKEGARRNRERGAGRSAREGGRAGGGGSERGERRGGRGSEGEAPSELAQTEAEGPGCGEGFAPAECGELRAWPRSGLRGRAVGVGVGLRGQKFGRRGACARRAGGGGWEGELGSWSHGGLGAGSV